MNHSSYNGHPKVVEYLLKKGSSVNTQRPDGTTPLYVASQNGHFEVVKLLVQANATINSICNDNKTTP